MRVWRASVRQYRLPASIDQRGEVGRPLRTTGSGRGDAAARGGVTFASAAAARSLGVAVRGTSAGRSAGWCGTAAAADATTSAIGAAAGTTAATATANAKNAGCTRESGRHIRARRLLGSCSRGGGGGGRRADLRREVRRGNCNELGNGRKRLPRYGVRGGRGAEAEARLARCKGAREGRCRAGGCLRRRDVARAGREGWLSRFFNMISPF